MHKNDIDIAGKLEEKFLKNYWNVMIIPKLIVFLYTTARTLRYFIVSAVGWQQLQRSLTSNLFKTFHESIKEVKQYT